MNNNLGDNRRSDDEIRSELSRRAFLRGAAAAGAGIGSIGVLSALGCAPGEQSAAQANDSGQTIIGESNVSELPIPDQEPLEKTEYEVDVLVIGAGFAGMFAANECKEKGKSVLVVDKGRVGHSGYMPWPHTFRWFDAELGDDREAHKKGMMANSEYTSNQDWYEVWMDESKGVYEQLNAWEFFEEYPESEGKFADPNAYHEQVAQFDRHTKWRNILVDNEIEFIENTMITDVLKEGDRVVAAMGFHNRTGEVITIRCKAAVMCAGAGSYKPLGYPTGTNSFDGEAIGYRLGLKVAGKEFSDFHNTASYAAGNAYETWGWPYLERVYLCGGVPPYEGLMVNFVMKYLDGGIPYTDAETSNFVRGGAGSHDLPESDPRSAGAWGTPVGSKNAPGGSVGMGIHKSEGIYVTEDKLDGSTDIPGFFVAGDSKASMTCGAIYCGGLGFSSGLSCIQGRRAAEAACAYADSVSIAEISPDLASQTKERILAPMNREKGYDPSWVRDVISATMAPYWVNYLKSEKTLVGALAQIEYIRDNVVPNLVAWDAHSLRLCHEAQNKVLSAEMKCRASLFRTESRGMHYRYEYPARDDENWLCYVTIRKGDDGSMVLEKAPMKEEWKGDLSMDYQERYPDRFPGELEYLGLA